MVYLFIYDYEEKALLYKFRMELHPILDSFSLPQLSDRANLCENNIDYSRKGVTVKVVARLDEASGLCVTSFDLSKENEFNFRGAFEKDFRNTENYSDVRALDKDKKHFFFNQKEYLNKCAFSLDVHQDLVQPPSDMQSLLAAAEAKPANSIYSEGVYADLEGPSARFQTPDLTPRDDCFGVFDYGRGVFTYKTNWFWTWGQGTATAVNEDNEREEVKLAVNFGGAIAHPEHLTSNEDYIKINHRIVRLHPVEMVYDKLNHMNGFVFRTAEAFRERGMQTVDLVFTTNFEKKDVSNFLVLKVG